MRIVNPYDGVDFLSGKRVKGISHEHIFTQESLKKAWDRGIRWFACVNYQPAVPAAPSLLSWGGTFKIWNYYDVSSAFPTGGSGGGNVYDHNSAVSKVPSNRIVPGIVISYFSTPDERVYEKYLNDAWVEIDIADLDSELVLIDWTYNNGIQSFVDSQENTINPDDIPALGNAEHAIFKDANGNTASSHFNVLGNMFSEACVWEAPWYPRSFINNHPIYELKDIKQIFTQDLQFQDKYFGTLNHIYDTTIIEQYIKIGDGLFKAMELFNQGFTKEANQMFRNSYDAILRKGYRLNVLAVADWQDSIEFIGYKGQDMSSYVKECNFTRGCNVLYMPDNYESLTKAEKTEAGLDAYISGAYFASGLGNYTIEDLSENNGVVHFKVSGSPSTVNLITNKRKVSFNTGEITTKIEPNETYIRFEVFYSDMDFIYTNPLWIEDNTSDKSAQNILLLDI